MSRLFGLNHTQWMRTFDENMKIRDGVAEKFEALLIEDTKNASASQIKYEKGRGNEQRKLK